MYYINGIVCIAWDTVNTYINVIYTLYLKASNDRITALLIDIDNIKGRIKGPYLTVQLTLIKASMYCRHSDASKIEAGRNMMPSCCINNDNSHMLIKKQAGQLINSHAVHSKENA